MAFLCEFAGCVETFNNLSQHVKHQQAKHSDSKNFLFTCASCKMRFGSLNSIQLHLRNLHGDILKPRLLNRPAGLYKCKSCELSKNSVKEICHHVVEGHLKLGGVSLCPLAHVCMSITSFSAVNSFRVHLSNYHQGWNNDISEEALVTDLPGPAVNIDHTIDDSESNQYQDGDIGGMESTAESSFDDEVTFDEIEHRDISPSGTQKKPAKGGTSMKLCTLVLQTILKDLTRCFFSILSLGSIFEQFEQKWRPNFLKSKFASQLRTKCRFLLI